MKRLMLALGLMLAAMNSAAARIDCQVGSTAMFARLLGTSCRSPSFHASADLAAIPAYLAPPAEIRRIVERIALQTGLEAKLVFAVIAVESAFDTRAVSPRNAQGLMQLMPETAARFGVRDPFDAAENIRGGATYLQWLLSKFGGNLDLALAAYNAGEGAVLAYGAVPPFDETIEYVGRVKRFYRLDIRAY
jgi:soluble lytic murein transglycosylase-like protein